MKIIVKLKGGKGSGDFGHSGRPGKVGGSGKGTGKNPVIETLELQRWHTKVKIGIMKVPAKGNVNSADITTETKESGMGITGDYVAIAYNSSSRSWYVPDDNFADHGDILPIARKDSGENPKDYGSLFEISNILGYLDVEGKEVLFYDVHNDWVLHERAQRYYNMSSTKFMHAIKKLQRQAEADLFTLDDEHLDVHYEPLNS